MVFPSPRDISNLVQRKDKSKQGHLSKVICDLQSAVQFCYDHSAHRLTQEQYDALPGDQMYFFFIICTMFTFLNTHHIFISNFIRFLSSLRIFLGEEGGTRTTYINSKGNDVTGLTTAYASKAMLKFSVVVFSQDNISLNNDFTFNVVNNPTVR